MGYRDEREALRARAEGLEQELGQVRWQLEEANEALRHAQRTTPQEKLAQLEQDLATAQRALNELREQIRDTERPPRGDARRPAAVLVGAAVGMMMLSGAAFLMLKPVRHVEAPPPAVRMPVVAPVPSPIPTPEAAPEPAPPPPAPRRTVEATWSGSVRKANGLALAPGSRCVVTAAISGDGEEIDVDDVTVRCGAQDLYRSSDALNGMSMKSSGASEQAGQSSGTFRYGLRYDDTGDRSGPKSQISLSTEAGQAKIWRTTVPSFEVELRLDTLSGLIEGRPLLNTSEVDPGFLTLVCSPTCDDVLDGDTSLGPSPIVHVASKPGQHRLTLRRGATQKSISVIVVPGQVTAQRVKLP